MSYQSVLNVVQRRLQIYWTDPNQKGNNDLLADLLIEHGSEIESALRIAAAHEQITAEIATAFQVRVDS